MKKVNKNKSIWKDKATFPFLLLENASYSMLFVLQGPNTCFTACTSFVRSVAGDEERLLLLNTPATTSGGRWCL